MYYGGGYIIGGSMATGDGGYPYGACPYGAIMGIICPYGDIGMA